MSGDPRDESTLAEPDQVKTVDARGDKPRPERAPPEAREPAPRAPAATIGRYQLLELVGSGGMGMVWGAWDPELERRVALKLVRLTSTSSRERILREGQVLARLSHPNVVPIFDVGVMDEQVYLVMEWVRGTTLRGYAAQAPGRRALLDAYRQAGAGLVAAHRAGVIHRDFKPDNALRGDDGRVRVLDFGLAHSDQTGDATPARAGTPRYMAPEQVRGEPLTAAIDQHAFGVSLREALGADPPAWIAAIVARSTAADPAGRFPSMAALLEALDHDPARRWRRGALAAAVAAAAVGAFAIGRARSPSGAAAIEPCVGGPAEIVAAWNPALRDRATAHLRGLGVLGAASAEGLGRELDDYAAAWVTTQRGACLAHERKELTEVRYDAQLGCLGRTRAQLAAVGELVSAVDADGVAAALTAARMLPDVRGCADVVEALVPPPAAVAAQVQAVTPRIERALVRATARRADAVVDASAATADARATGYQPLIARALLVEGRAALVIGRDDARALLAEATSLALRASDDATAVEAYARRVFAAAIRGETALDGWPLIVAVGERLGARGQFARGLLYNNRGVASLVADDWPGARAMFERARTEAGDSPEIELVSIVQNVAQLDDDAESGERLMQQAFERLRAALGPDHPDTLNALLQVGLLTRDLARARAQIEAACDGLIRVQQPQLLGDCVYEAGWIADTAGDRPAAARWMAQVPAAATPKARIAAAYVAMRSGTAAPAAIVAEMEQLAALPEPKFWQRAEIADALVVAALATPRPLVAAQAWRRALATLEVDNVAVYRRRRLRARQVVAGAATAPGSR